MAQVARAQTEAAGGPEQLKRLVGPVPRHGRARAGDRRSRGTVREVDDGVAVVDTRGRAGRQRDHPQRRGRAARVELDAVRARGRPTIESDAHAAPGADPAQGRRGLPATGAARGLEGARRRRRARLRARRRSATSWRCSRSTGLLAHPHTSAGRVPTDAGHRYFVDRLLPEPRAGAPRRWSWRWCAARSTRRCASTTETLSQVTNLLAIVTAPPIDTATIRHVEVLLLQPQVADGRRHHLDRRRLQARVHVRRARSTRGSRLGRRATSTSGWSGIGLGARMLHAAARTTRRCRRTERGVPRARSRRPSPSSPTTRRGHAVRRRRRAAARRATASQDVDRRSTS